MAASCWRTVFTAAKYAHVVHTTNSRPRAQILARKDIELEKRQAPYGQNTGFPNWYNIAQPPPATPPPLPAHVCIYRWKSRGKSHHIFPSQSLCFFFGLSPTYRPFMYLTYPNTQSRESAGIFLSSLELGLPHPSHLHVSVPPPLLVPGGGAQSLAGEEVGGSQFERGDIRCGTPGIYVLCAPCGKRYGSETCVRRTHRGILCGWSVEDGPWVFLLLYFFSTGLYVSGYWYSLCLINLHLTSPRGYQPGFRPSHTFLVS